MLAYLITHYCEIGCKITTFYAENQIFDAQLISFPQKLPNRKKSTCPLRQKDRLPTGYAGYIYDTRFVFLLI